MTIVHTEGLGNIHQSHSFVRGNWGNTAKSNFKMCIRDRYNTLIYGIEGEDYTKNADGTITTSYVGASPTADDSYGIQRLSLIHIWD